MKRYGISSWIVNSLSAGEGVEKMAASGFKEVEISGAASGMVKEWEDNPVSVCRKMRSVDIYVRSIHSPVAGRRLDDTDEAIRRASIAADLDYFSKMAESGIEEIVIHPTGSGDFSTQEKRDLKRSLSMESLKPLAEHAGRMGVRMAVENLGSDRPGSAMSGLLELIKGLGDHVGICFDVGHAEQAHFDLIQQLKLATSSGKLFSLHIHDVNAAGKDHFIPGEGRIDWDTFISELDASDFQGGRILEISPPENNVSERLSKAAGVRDKWEAYL